MSQSLQRANGKSCFGNHQMTFENALCNLFSYGREGCKDNCSFLKMAQSTRSAVDLWRCKMYQISVTYSFRLKLHVYSLQSFNSVKNVPFL